jgi:carboxylate-amine ligase
VDRKLPPWATWRAGSPSKPYTLGIEEEALLLDPSDWSLVHRADEVVPALPAELQGRIKRETHASVIELSTGVHTNVADAAQELRALRARLSEELDARGLRAAATGTHPFASWRDVVVSKQPRYQLVQDSMRELARREPTLALHVHVGVTTPHQAIQLANRLRAHLPLLLALSANSPFWEGRNSGLASARTPLFQAFPRVGVPRRFESYGDYVEAVDLLIRSGAIPEPTFLWWDVRPQPRLGTVEVRVMDTQTTVSDTAALAAFVQALARTELERGLASSALLDAPEAIAENRFLAARDAMEARLVDPDTGGTVPALALLEGVVAACEPAARTLGCAEELASVRYLAAENGAARQISIARETGLSGLMASLADAFAGDAPFIEPASQSGRAPPARRRPPATPARSA